MPPAVWPELAPPLTLQDDGDGVGRAAKFIGDLGNEAALAFVSEGDTDVGDQLAGKGEK